MAGCDCDISIRNTNRKILDQNTKSRYHAIAASRNTAKVMLRFALRLRVSDSRNVGLTWNLSFSICTYQTFVEVNKMVVLSLNVPYSA